MKIDCTLHLATNMELFHLFHIICPFDFYRYISFVMYLDISIYLAT
jgi:hypothetical protein